MINISTKTTNLNLVKPSQNDYFDIDVLNQNMDTIDAAVGNLGDSLTATIEALLNSKLAPLTTKLEQLSSSISKIVPAKKYTTGTGVELFSKRNTSIGNWQGYPFIVFVPQFNGVVSLWVSYYEHRLGIRIMRGFKATKIGASADFMYNPASGHEPVSIPVDFLVNNSSENNPNHFGIGVTAGETITLVVVPVEGYGGRLTHRLTASIVDA